MAIIALGSLAEISELRWLEHGALGLPTLPAIRFSLLAQPGGSPARARLVDGIVGTVDALQRRLDAPVLAV